MNDNALQLVGQQMLHAARTAAEHDRIKLSARRFRDASAVLAFLTKQLAGVSPVPTCLETPTIPTHTPASPDSDDVAAWMASILIALGYEVRLVFVSTPPRGVWCHVYVEARRGDDAWTKYEYAPVNYTPHETVIVE